MSTCVSMNCPFVVYCKEYNFLTPKDDKCSVQDFFYNKALRDKTVAPCNIGDEFYYPVPVLDKIILTKVSMLTLTKKGVWKIRFDSSYCQDLPYTDYNVKFFKDYMDASEYLIKYKERYKY